MLVRVVWCFAMIVLSVAQAFPEGVERAPRPDWVIEHELAEPVPERREFLEDGHYYLLHDQQVRWDGVRSQYFHRIAYRITERAGLEKGSSISREFDPSFQTLTLHAARIRRGDTTLDLAGDLEITLIRRETELDSGILDGDLTAHMYLPSVRVGDIVDLEFSWDSRPHVGRDHFSTAFAPHYSVPVGAMHYRVVYPKDKVLAVRAQETDLEPVPQTQGTWSELQWEQRDPDPLTVDKSVPDWHRPWGFVDVSSVPGWDAVVEDFLPHYPDDVALPPEFAARIDAIAAAQQGSAWRLAEALRLVQDEIRYVGIEIGPGGFIARSPEETLRKGYGDCKDKSVLLAAILRRLGFDAVPALTHLTRGKELPLRLPSFNVFDHMIVRAEIDGDVYWLDPTSTYQGGLGGTIVPSSAYHALPLRAGQADLEEIPQIRVHLPTMEVTETFTLGGEGEPVDLEVVSARRSFSADWMRRELASKSLRALSRKYHRYYADYYSGIYPTAPPEISDDRDRNRVVVTERYRLNWADFTGNGLNENFPLRGDTLINVLEDPSTAQSRRTPLYQPFPTHLQHRIVVRNTPGPYAPPGHMTLRNEHYVMSQRPQSTPGDFTITWTLKTRTDHVDREDVAHYVAGVGNMENQLIWYYGFYEDAVQTQAPSDPDAPEGGLLNGLQRLMDLLPESKG